MTSTKPHWIAIIILSSVLVAIGIKFIVLGNTASGDDGRIAVILEPAERQAVLGEMRLLLETTQSIVEALANNDLQSIEQSARAVGKAAISTVDFQLRAKLPLDFKKLGFATHYAFDDIADMAQAKAPIKDIQIKLADTMNNCVACHSSFQLPVITKHQ
jgi:hypothetical protein